MRSLITADADGSCAARTKRPLKSAHAERETGSVPSELTGEAGDYIRSFGDRLSVPDLKLTKCGPFPRRWRWSCSNRSFSINRGKDTLRNH